MGSAPSAAAPRKQTSQEIYRLYTDRASTGFDTLELKYIRDTFDQLATPAGDTFIWTQETFGKFLELPDDIGPLFFCCASYIASFPLLHESPVILTHDALLRTIAILLGRAENVIDRSGWYKLVFDSLAVLEVIQEKSEPSQQDEKLHVSDNGTHNAVANQTLSMRRMDLIKVVKFLLTIRDKSPLEVISQYIDRMTGIEAEQFQEVALSIIDTISTAEQITFKELSHTAQHFQGLFDTFTTLYSHFLYPFVPSQKIKKQLRPSSSNSLLNTATACQLSLFLPKQLLFGKIDLLYRASHDGFSMASFESKVLRYPGPSVLILEGRSDLLGKVRFGLYSAVPWKQSSKETFGDSETVLFELLPRHRVYKAPRLQHGTWFSKPSGIGIGCLPPTPLSKRPDFGHLSLVLDTSLEYAMFRDDSLLDALIKVEIQDVEVCGLGGDKEAQRKAWEWEENEANRRRTINVKDMQGDYDLLEMAGLVGQNRSGGSV